MVDLDWFSYMLVDLQYSVQYAEVKKETEVKLQTRMSLEM